MEVIGATKKARTDLNGKFTVKVPTIRPPRGCSASRTVRGLLRAAASHRRARAPLGPRSIARGGFAFSVGFPLRLRDVYLGRAVWAGYTVVEADEVDRLRRTCASPQVVRVWIPGQPNAAGKERRGP